MSNTRVQIRDLPTARLGTAPVARDTFTQVAAPIPNREAENLIDALGFFNRNLSGLGTAMRQKRQKDDDELAQRQENAINLSTTEQKAEISRSGTIGGEPLANARLKKMAGAADGAEWLSGVKEHLVTQNLGELDVEGFIRQQAGEYMKGVNGDPFITGGFARYVDEAVGWAKSQQTSQGLQAREELAQNTTFQYLKTRVNEWVIEGVSPEQLHANVRQFYSDVGAGKDRVTTEALLDNHVMSVASQLVATNPEMAMALITQGRKGEDGTEIGSLADSPRFAPQVAAIVQQGQKVIRDRTTLEAQQANRRENFDRVVTKGDYAAFQDFTVNGKTVPATEQQTQFLHDLNAGLDAQVTAGTMTPAQKRAEVRRVTSRAGIEDPLIKSELDGMEKRYSSVDAASDPQYLQDLERRMALYKEYKETNRNALLAKTTRPTQDFAEAFDLHKRYLGSSTEAAFEFANQVVNPANGIEQNLAFKRQDIVRKVNGKLAGWIKDDSQTYNTMYAGQIEKVAGLFVRSGMDVDMAIDAATDRVFENTFHYGGDPLLGLEKQNLPEDYQEILGQMAEDYTVLDARGRKFQGTPTFVHLDGGVIAMRDRENGTFLEDENGSLIVFNVQHIRKLSAERAKAKDAMAVKSAAEAQSRQREYEVQRTDRLNMDPAAQREVIQEKFAPVRTFVDFLRDTLGGD